MHSNDKKIAFLRRVFKGADVARDGVNIAVRCPNKKCKSRIDGKKKLSIRIDTDQAHCWVCELKTHSNLVPVLRRVCTNDQIQDYIEKYLPKQARRKNDSNLFGEKRDESTDNEVLLDFPEDFRMLATLINSRVPDIQDTLRYLKRRGVRERDLWYYKLGVSRASKFHRRVIMPSFDKDGFINYYTARAIDRKSWPPYVLPPVGKVELVFNECNIDWSKELTIVEGPFDLVKCNTNSTCIQGSGLTEDYILFWKLVKNKTDVLLALDADAKKKANKFAKLLNSYAINVRLLDLGKFGDVGEMSHKEFLEARSNAKQWQRMDAIREKIMNMSPTTRAAL